MLSEISATEFNDWIDHFSRIPFMPQLIDVEFASLNTTLLSALCGIKAEMSDFMLLTDIEASDTTMTDEAIQLAGEGIAGGVRYEPSNR